MFMGLTWLAPFVAGSVPDTGSLLRDTTSVADVPALFGAASRLLNLVWAAAATLLIVAAGIAAPQRRAPLQWLGVLTLVLTLDDTLLLHDDLLPERGVPEGLVLTVYALLGLVLAARWWPDRASAVGLAFFVGGILLGSSVLVDAVFDDLYLLEDTLKLSGVVAWLLCGKWAIADGLEQGRRRPTPPAESAQEATVYPADGHLADDRDGRRAPTPATAPKGRYDVTR